MLAPSQIRARGDKLHTALDRVIEQRGWSMPKRRAHQWRTLKALVQHAFDHIPLYQRLFKAADFVPEMLDDWADLQRLPILSKQDLRSATEADLSVDPHPRWLASSGSTGIPAKIARTDESLWHYMAFNTALFHDWCDGRPITNSLYLADLAPDSIDFAATDLLRTTVPDSRIQSVHDPVGKLTSELLRIAPAFISSYPSTLRAIALELGRKTIPQTKLIHLTSEMLDAPTRQLLHRVFPSARLIETYTSTEGGLVAFQCLHDARWHIAETNVICEIVDEHGRPTDGPGQIVITDLTNTATPIIRYRGLGDLARWETTPCPCGSALRSIRQLEGRSAAMLRTRSGQLISPFVITNAIEEVPGLAQYQVRQTKPGSIEVHVVASAGAPPYQIERSIQQALAQTADTELEIHFVPAILPPSHGHKVPLVVSELAQAA